MNSQGSSFTQQQQRQNKTNSHPVGKWRSKGKKNERKKISTINKLSGQTIQAPSEDSC